MRDAKCVPEYNISIVDAFLSVLCDPFGKTSRRLAGRLGDMAASGVDLVILV